MDVVLVALNPDLDEMRSLLHAAGYRAVKEVVQRRPAPDGRYFVGKGKLEELKDVVRESGAVAAVFAGALHPKQHHHLERALGVPCHDRIRVILDIFTQRASGPEAKLQVEYAMLQYEIPLLKEWIHAAAAGERPGFMSGGEYRVDAYYETVKRKMVKIRRALEAVRRERALRRGRRETRGFYHVSIAGYANAGKSSLFNALSGETVTVEDRLFTTLSTTTRVLGGAAPERRILLTDTVGLVSDVPLWLIEAFRSTFEESLEADLLLLTLDASDSMEDVRAKAELAASVLLAGADSPIVQTVLTKRDLVSQERLEMCFEYLRASPFPQVPIAVSVVTGQGMSELRERIRDAFRLPVEMSTRIARGPDAEPFLHWLYEHTDVLEVRRNAEDIEVRLRCRERDVEPIARRSRADAPP